MTAPYISSPAVHKRVGGPFLGSIGGSDLGGGGFEGVRMGVLWTCDATFDFET